MTSRASRVKPTPIILRRELISALSDSAYVLWESSLDSKRAMRLAAAMLRMPFSGFWSIPTPSPSGEPSPTPASDSTWCESPSSRLRPTCYGCRACSSASSARLSTDSPAPLSRRGGVGPGRGRT